METRLGLLADVPALAVLHAASFGAAHFAGSVWDEKQITDSLNVPANQCWVVGDSDALHGFIFCQLVGEEAEILTFCVAPDRRRHHLGQGLLGAAVNAAQVQGARKMFLEVAVDNDAALAFYEKAGFVQAGRRPEYYKRENGFVDALMLVINF